MPCQRHVVERSGKYVLWRTTVVNSNDDGLQACGEDPAQPIMRLERAGHPTAAVCVEHERHRSACRRPIDAQPDGGGSTRDVHVLDRRERERLSAEQGRCGFRRRA